MLKNLSFLWNELIQTCHFFYIHVTIVQFPLQGSRLVVTENNLLRVLFKFVRGCFPVEKKQQIRSTYPADPFTVLER